VIAEGLCDAESKSTPALTEGNASDKFATEVLQGLSRPSKTWPCRFFYDPNRSELFERITRLLEYYVTCTETAILRSHADAMACSILREEC
jgi:L-histidine Nalpha-methyltransferase